jgi:hypothetical protein
MEMAAQEGAQTEQHAEPSGRRAEAADVMDVEEGPRR